VIETHVKAGQNSNIQNEALDLAERIKAARTRAGLTQFEAAKAWSVQRDTLASWERGRIPRMGERYRQLQAALSEAEKSPPAIDWAARIKAARKKAGLSVQQAAERWGIPHSSLYFWDTRRRNIQPNKTARAHLESFLSKIEKGLSEPTSLESPIRSLKINRHSESILDAAQIKTVGDLVAVSADALLKQRSCGPASIRNIEAALAEEGFSLAPTPPTTPKALKEETKQIPRDQVMATKEKSWKSIVFIREQMVVDRGWTKSQIKKLLGEPDAVLLNYAYSNNFSRPSLKLYLLSRVESAERSVRWLFAGKKQDERHAWHKNHEQYTIVE
jgi:transcriptional regulator with XRE-family HTH domain